MSQTSVRQVTDREGIVGFTDPAADAPEAGSDAARCDEGVTIRLNGGGRIFVPVQLLDPQPDGSLRLTVPVRQLLAEAPARRAAAEQTIGTVPLAEEQVAVGKREVETGRVVVRVSPETREEVIDVPLTTQHVDVTRVEVNQFVQQPPPVRQAGDTIVVPVLEEVLVVERRLLLREEVHIARRSETRHEPQHVDLRTETVRIDRLPPGAPPEASDPIEPSTRA